MKKYLFIVFMVIFSFGCTKTVHLQSDISQDEASYFKNKTGNNTIIGSGFLKRNDGMTVTCAGNDVVLMPVIPYTTERMQARYGNTAKGSYGYYQNRVDFKNEDPKLAQITKSTMCNAEGFFKFKNIPDGEYYLATSVVWNPIAQAFGEQGGALMRRVSISGGEEIEVVLSK